MHLPAWVIVGPPDFAPPLENIVTAYDLLYDLALRKFGYDSSIFDPGTGQWQPGFRPSFSRDIFPILRRAFDYRWVINEASRHRSSNFSWSALGPAPSPGETPQTNPRGRIFVRLRDPDHIDPDNDVRTMPRLHNDGTGGFEPEQLMFTVTRTQYEFLRRWAAGQFVADWTGQPPPAETQITPAGLDRAALEAACGGAFFPGMEASWNLRDTRLYVTPFEFRFRHAQVEGDPTGVMPAITPSVPRCPGKPTSAIARTTGGRRSVPIKFGTGPRRLLPWIGCEASMTTSTWSTSGGSLASSRRAAIRQVL